MKEKISIIIPVYNSEKYLSACLDSILCQTYGNLQVIVVNDGSTDQSGRIAEEYAARDSRVQVYQTANQSVSKARNYGLERADGEYIGFVDSDDHIAPRMYECMLERLKKDDADMAVCDYCRFQDQMIPNGKGDLGLADSVLTPEEVLHKYVTEYRSDYISMWNRLYRRELFDGIIFPPGKVNEDAFVLPEITWRCRRISHLNAVFYFYRQHPASLVHGAFSLATLDGIEAFIVQYRFSRRIKNRELMDYCCFRLSYRFENWKPMVMHDRAMLKRYRQLKREALFLLFEKGAWPDYSWKGKIVARIRFLCG